MNEQDQRLEAMYLNYHARTPCDERAVGAAGVVAQAILAATAAVLPVLLDIRDALEESAGIVRKWEE